MTNDPYIIDFPGRIQAIQAEMAKDGVDVYLGSRLRTLSWTTDAFCPWRSYIVIPARLESTRLPRRSEPSARSASAPVWRPSPNSCWGRTLPVPIEYTDPHFGGPCGRRDQLSNR